jgi:hypothetical protein
VGSVEFGSRQTDGDIVFDDSIFEIDRDEVTKRARIAPDSEYHALLGGERMARALEQIRIEMTETEDQASRQRQVVVSAAEGAMLAASFSWLALLLRGGSLAAVAFSSLPLWHRVDPLAVLAVSEEERRRREEDLRKARQLEDEKDRGVGRLLDRT